MFLSVDYALACDTLPSLESAAQGLGVWGVSAFLGSTTGPLIAAPLLAYFGCADGSQAAQASHACRPSCPVPCASHALTLSSLTSPPSPPPSRLPTHLSWTASPDRYSSSGYVAVNLVGAVYVSCAAYFMRCVKTR